MDEGATLSVVGNGVGFGLCILRQNAERLFNFDIHRNADTLAVCVIQKVEDGTRSNRKLDLTITARIENNILPPVKERHPEINLDNAVVNPIRAQDNIMDGGSMIKQAIDDIHRLAANIIDNSFPPRGPKGNALDITIESPTIYDSGVRPINRSVKAEDQLRPSRPVRRQRRNKAVDS